MDSIKTEFIEQYKLTPKKIFLFGSPYSGKSLIANTLSKHFELEVINKENLINKYMKEESELGESIRSCIDEKKNEIIELNLKNKEFLTNKKKKKKYVKIDENDIELPEKLMV